MNHLVLLGDSIFDNGAYVGSGQPVIVQVNQQLQPNGRATLLAVDGDTASMVQLQLQRIPQDASHLVLSVGGNDALGCIPGLETSASSVKQGLVLLSQIKTDFEVSYRALISTLLNLNRPLMVCTVYDHVPGLPTELKTALGLFNDVILHEAIHRGLPVLDLRMICTEPGDYSVISPIEPSSQGGAKLAARLVAALTQHDFKSNHCRVYS